MVSNKAFDLINALTVPSFRAQAYADYLDSCAQNYNSLVNASSEALDDDYDIDDAAMQALAEQGITDPTDEQIESMVTTLMNDDTILEQRADAILTKYGISANAPITLNEGYTNALDMFKFVIHQSDLASQDEDDPIGHISEEILSLTNIKGEALTAKASIDGIMASLRGTLHSTITTAACAAASKYTSISDRLQVFNDKIQNTFASAYNDLSGSLNYFKGILSDTKASCEAICTQINSAINAASLANDSSSINTVDATDLSKYTGASPMAAMDFSTAGNILKTVATTTAKVVTAAVAGVVTTFWNKLVKPGLFKAVSHVYHTVKPYDLEVIDDKIESQIIDGWDIAESDSVSIDPDDIRQILSDYQSSLTYSQLLSKLDKLIGKWIKMDLIFAQMFIKISSRRTNTFSYLIKYKPKPVDWFGLSACLITSVGNSGQFYRTSSTSEGTLLDTYAIHYNPNGTDNWPSVIANIEDFVASHPNPYEPIILTDQETNVEGNEKELYNSFLWSTKFMTFFGECCRNKISNEMPQQGSEPDSVATQMGIIADQSNIFASEVTNKMFIAAASGWNGSGDDFKVANMYVPSEYDAPVGYYSGLFSANKYFRGMILTFLYQQILKEVDPYGYPFLAYRNDVSEYDEPRFRVKTDTENQAALTNFITNATLIIIAATVALTVGIGVIKWKKARYWKKVEFLGKSDSAMWDGQSLTNKERRKYLRYQRKLGLSSANDAGMAGSNIGSLVTGIKDSMTAGNYQDVTRLLRPVT